MIKGKITHTFKDTGLAKFKTRVTKMAKGKPGITVGVHSDADGSYEGISIQEIATIHEFGLGAPQRSFIRAWVEEEKTNIDNAINQMAGQIALGKVDEKAGLDQLGLLFVASIQKRIAGGIEPANAPSTIARKGSSTPLIDTGQLRASIAHKVEAA